MFQKNNNSLTCQLSGKNICENYETSCIRGRFYGKTTFSSESGRISAGHPSPIAPNIKHYFLSVWNNEQLDCVTLLLIHLYQVSCTNLIIVMEILFMPVTFPDVDLVLVINDTMAYILLKHQGFR